MNRPVTAALFLVLSLSLFAWIPAARANVTLTITATETDGNVVVSYGGSITTSFLEPFYGPYYSAIYGRVAPSTSLVYFGEEEFSAPNALRYYNDPVITSPASMGSGNLSRPSSFTGSYFIITPLFVGVPANYISGSQISGTMTFEGETFESLGFDTTPGSYFFELTNLETVAFSFEDAPIQLSPEAILKLKVAQLKYKLRLAERRKKRSVIKRLEPAIVRTKEKLRNLRIQG